MTNEVLETEEFSQMYERCETIEREWIEKMRDQLAENLEIGKPLRFNWLREKKLGDKRLFYVINEKTNKALLVAFGEKKEQTRIINVIMLKKESYLKFIT